MALAALVHFLKVRTPGICYQDKIDHLKLRSDYKLARQREIAIGQEFEYRGRFRGGWATATIVAAVVLWCGIFVLGKSIAAIPFQLLLNIVSAEVVNDATAFKIADSAKNGNPTLPPQSSLFNSFVKTPLVNPAPQTLTTTATKAKLNIARIRDFFGIFDIKDDWKMWLLAAAIALLTNMHTNMLLLACLAAVIGSMCNYAVQALKQARDFASRSIAANEMQGSSSPGAPRISPKTSIFGHRRVFSSLLATLVTGISLGFAAFLACAAGLLLFPNVINMGSPEGYEIAVCTASFAAFIVALFPDRALLFIENRVNNATDLAVAAQQQRGTRDPVDPNPGRPGSSDGSGSPAPGGGGGGPPHMTFTSPIIIEVKPSDSASVNGKVKAE